MWSAILVILPQLVGVALKILEAYLNKKGADAKDLKFFRELVKIVRAKQLGNTKRRLEAEKQIDRLNEKIKELESES